MRSRDWYNKGGIEMMTIAGRIHRLEASLEAEKKFFLWLQHAKAKGGFIRYWEQELVGPLVPFEWFADEEAHFLYFLVNDVNFTILNSASTNQDLNVLAYCALDGLLRQISRPDQSGALVPVRPIPEIKSQVGGYLWAKFRTLLEEALSIAAAIDEISETYLGGEDILFADSRGTIDAETSTLRKTAEIYGSLAEWLNLEPITIECFTPGHPMVDTKADQLVHLSRAQALMCRDDRRKSIDALRRVCPKLVEGAP
jgi:hypothetical protein